MSATKSPDLRAKLAEVSQEIEAKQSVAADKWQAFEQARDEFASAGNDANRTDSDEFKAADAIHKEYSVVAGEVKELEKVRNGIFSMLSDVKPGQPADPSDAQRGELAAASDRADVRSIGERSVESDGYKALLQSGALSSERLAFNEHLSKSSRDELKALIAPQSALITGNSDTSAGAFVVTDRKAYVPQPRRPMRILDLITVGDTDSDLVDYVRQSAFTNVAAETAEAVDTATGTKPEATITFAIIQAAVKTIAHWVPSTRRALSDAGQLRTLIDSQLRYGLDLRLENQVVNGNGTGENLTGILNTGSILSQAKGSDSVSDAIHKAITQIRLGFIEPNGVALHPSDWEVVRLSRDDSGAAAGTGGYLYGPPSTAVAEQIWGLPVAVTAAVPDDTGLVGDFRFASLWLREGAQVLATDSHSDFFIKNLVAILAEMRAAFGVTLPAAFCKVTSVD